MDFSSSISSNIDTAGISSVKEMIFSRAKEKSNSIADETTQELIGSVKNDVMTSARESISGRRNLQFGDLTQQQAEKNIQPNNTEHNVPQLKYNIESVQTSVYSKSIQNDVMNSARNQFNSKISLSDTLKFLNTQAAINLAQQSNSKIK